MIDKRETGNRSKKDPRPTGGKRARSLMVAAMQPK